MGTPKDELQFYIIHDDILGIINQYLVPETIVPEENPYGLIIYDTEKNLELDIQAHTTLIKFMNGHRFLAVSNGQCCRFDSSLDGVLAFVNWYFSNNKVVYL